MATFGEKIKANYIALEESIHKRSEVGALGQVAGEDSDSQVDLGRKDREKTVVERNVRVKVHRPKLGSHVEDIISRQVYGCVCVSTGEHRVETRMTGNVL